MTKLEGITAAFNALMNNNSVSVNKRISKNTIVSVNNGVLSVWLHDTRVFCFDVNSRKVTLKTGGWFTTTTRNAINTAFAACNLNYKVSFTKGCFKVYGVENVIYNNYAYSFAA